jgi:hypothetical protein
MTDEADEALAMRVAALERQFTSLRARCPRWTRARAQYAVRAYLLDHLFEREKYLSLLGEGRKPEAAKLYAEFFTKHAVATAIGCPRHAVQHCGVLAGWRDCLRRDLPWPPLGIEPNAGPNNAA